VLCVFLVLAALPAGSPNPLRNSAASASAAAGAAVLFVENVGQFDPHARFQVRGASETLWLAEDAIWITVLGKQADQEQVDKADCDPLLASLPTCTPSAPRGVNLRLTFPGANPHPRLEPFDRLDTTVSYFIGGDPARWRANVPVWSGVRYVDLYPGVDLEISSSPAGHWAWQLAPQSVAARQSVGWNGDPVLRVEGAGGAAVRQERLCLDVGNGDYCLPLLLGPMMSEGEGPISLPNADAFNIALPVVSPAVSDHLRARQVLLDEPADLVYSTYLGGMAEETGQAVALDQGGNAYITGDTRSIDFPTTPGSFDPTHNLNLDAYVVRLNTSGTDLLYATFIGGSDTEGGVELRTNAQGEVYLAGTTYSADFPTTPGAFDATFNGEGDAFVAQLSADGAELLFATYVGGQSIDGGSGIDRDDSGNIYIAGPTISDDFPTTAGAFDTSHNGSGDSFVAKLSSDGANLIYGTYIGGSDPDWANTVAVASPCDVVITGNTQSSDYPTTTGAFDPTYNGSAIAGLGDAYATRLDCDGANLVYSTFLGGFDGDTGHAIAVDDSGRTVIAGATDSPNFPTTPDAFDPTFNGYGELARDVFVVKLNVYATALEFGTFLGGNNQEAGYALALDESGNVAITGQTDSADFPTTPDAFDTTFNGVPGVSDAFISKLSANGAEMVYSSFFDVIYGSGIASDSSHQIVFTGRSGANLPTTPNAFDPTYNGGFNDGFVAKLNLIEPTAVGLAELAAGPASQPPLLAPWLAVAAALAIAFLVEFTQRRHRAIIGS
jgi:hypothetical protein